MSSQAEIDALIEQFQKSGLREMHVRCDEFEIYLSTDANQPGIDAAGPVRVESNRPAGASPPARRAPQDATLHAALAATPPAQPAPQEWPADAVLVRAPYLGTFYRAPKPGSPAYVELGVQVTPDTELCMVEVMKLFTALRAGMVGKVHAILADDGQLVQAQQPLFVLRPVS